QVVYLDFDSWKTRVSASLVPFQHVYTQAERDAIQARLGADYADFAFTFTQVKPASGSYVSLVFNVPRGDYSVGAADEIDWRDLNPNGAATIDVNHFLGGPAQPTTTIDIFTDNFVSLSATIAAHELGHLSGLQHGDSFGPIGAGVFGRIKTDPNRQFLPVYS